MNRNYLTCRYVAVVFASISLLYGCSSAKSDAWITNYPATALVATNMQSGNATITSTVTAVSGREVALKSTSSFTFKLATASTVPREGTGPVRATLDGTLVIEVDGAPSMIGPFATTLDIVNLEGCGSECATAVGRCGGSAISAQLTREGNRLILRAIGALPLSSTPLVLDGLSLDPITK